MKETHAFIRGGGPSIQGDYFDPECIEGPVKPNSRKPSYRADDGWEGEDDWVKWRPSIFMPRWASRITLTLTDVRLERLQEISLEDAQAEGGFTAVEQFAGSYAETWDWINGAGSWSTNPWVWALSFSVEVRR